MAHITSIVYSPKLDYEEPADHYLRVPVTMADLVAGHGINGDRKGSQPDRGLNIMSAEIMATLAPEGFKTAPGQLGEQICLSGLDFSTLNINTQSATTVPLPLPGVLFLSGFFFLFTARRKSS